MPNIINTRADYDATKAINCSGMKELLKSPAHYKASLTAEKSESKALKIGSFVHALALEPDTVLQRFALIPEGIDRRTKEGKVAYEAFLTASAGKISIAGEDWDMGHFVADSFDRAQKSLGVTFTKTEFMFSVDYCGTTLKSAIDAVGDDGYLYDLKTTEDASPKGFLNSVRSYRYNLQAHFYRLAYEAAFGERLKGFRFIAVEKNAPYEFAIYELGPELMTYAAMDFEEGLKAYKSCAALDEWPGYGSEIRVLDIGAKTTAPATPIQFA